MSTQPSVYADTAGAAQPLPGLIESVCHQLLSTQLANPHSRNAASRATTEMVDNVRHRILQHLNTNRDEYSVIFTASATASLKLLAESFQFATNDYVTTNSAYYADADLIDDGSDKDKPASFTLDESARLPMIPKFAYLQDNHTSVLGMRDIVKKQHVQVLCVKDEQQINRLVISKPKEGTPERTRENCSLFVYPAQSNFNGRKYPMEWTERIRHLTSGCEDYYICVDAAGQVGTSPLDLSTYKPDFVTMSFYKMFGFPTGVGALLVHKSAQPRMAKTYFGGGAVDVSLPTANMHKLRETFHERYEDGTLNYHGIMAVGLGLEMLQKLGGIQSVQNHTLAITNYAIQLLSALKHHNDKPVLKVYSKDMSDYTRPDNQGPIINFNIIKDDGSFVGYTEVEKMAEMYNIELRTGCFCNQGACMLYLGITQKQVMDNFKSGKKCGDEVDMIDGMPVGSVRISFGAHSTAANVQRIAAMIYDCFVVRSPLPFDAIVGKVQQPKTVLTQALTKNLKPTSGKMMNGKTNGLSNGHSNGYHGENGVNGHDVINGMELAASTTVSPSSSGYSLTDIYVYPVKSCRPCRVRSWKLADTGFEYDRLWLVADKHGVTITQKRVPKMCYIQPTLTKNRTQLRLEWMGPTPAITHSGVQTSHEIPIELSSESAAANEICEHTVCADRLANVAQYLVVSRASIRALLKVINAEEHLLDEQHLIERFRPNLVVDTAEAFEEDTWTSMTLNGVLMKVVEKCHRCQMISIDQQTGIKNPKILTALRDFRKGQMTFGVYMATASADSMGKQLVVGSEILVKTN